ncbi:MAG: hypothetical protein IKA73_01180 [Alphaproteobacteria bacterium]|nr:hypothetical protein [Alphaproteobacteria bacterium]
MLFHGVILLYKYQFVNCILFAIIASVMPMLASATLPAELQSLDTTKWTPVVIK